MTPEEISKLSDTELNELIAVKRGWKVDYYVDGDDEEHNKITWLTNKGVLVSSDFGMATLSDFQWAIPDYAGSWRWCGELLVEMANKIERIELVRALCTNGKKFWCVRGNDKIPNVSNSPTRAIAEAWYLMECEK